MKIIRTAILSMVLTISTLGLGAQDWTVIASDYEYSMNIIGQVSISGNIVNQQNSAYVANINYLHGENNDLFGAGLGVYQSYSEVDGLLFGLGLNTVFAEDFAAIPFFIHAMYVLPFFDYFPKNIYSHQSR